MLCGAEVGVMSELTESERVALACEIAADGYPLQTLVNVCEECNLKQEVYGLGELVRSTFHAGWDAAMEYVNVQTKKQQQQQCSTNSR